MKYILKSANSTLIRKWVSNMATEMHDLTRIETSNKLPPGQYKGEWSGYTVEFDVGTDRFRAGVYKGYRGHTPCIVTVSETGMTVEVDEPQGEETRK